MKISDIYNKKKSLSFEIFPPKKDSELENIDETLKVLCELNPDYIIPKAFDKRVGPAVAKAVAKAARDTKVARI